MDCVLNGRPAAVNGLEDAVRTMRFLSAVRLLAERDLEEWPFADIPSG